MRVLRVYHAGRDAGHRRRERALREAGVDVTLVVPRVWHDPGSERTLSDEPFEIVELDVARPGDVNRHRYTDTSELRDLISAVRPEVLDIHEEPFSVATRQWLDAAGDVPAVLYTAQNLDKRFPPPFARFEISAYRRARGLYPCSRQAASVARGKGFGGLIRVLPLGVNPEDFPVGEQRHGASPFVLGVVGRLVPEKGLQDAVQILASLSTRRQCRLLVVGEGPDLGPSLALAESLGVRRAVEVQAWGGSEAIARAYRRMHVLLVPSRATPTWVEQFGRVIVEAQASGCVVAAYDCGSISEVCDGTGLVVKEGDTGAMAGAVQELAGDPVVWARLRADGMGRSGDFAWSTVARGQQDLYAAVLDGRDQPRMSISRNAARAEFGPTAHTSVGDRPIALPGFRSSATLNGVAGRLIDLTAGGLDRAGRSG